jgi:hypothetical protein
MPSLEEMPFYENIGTADASKILSIPWRAQRGDRSATFLNTSGLIFDNRYSISTRIEANQCVNPDKITIIELHISFGSPSLSFLILQALAPSLPLTQPNDPRRCPRPGV